jgi:hypothetical protein
MPRSTVVQWSILWPFLALAVILGAGMLMNLTGYFEILKSTEVTAFDVGYDLQLADPARVHAGLRGLPRRVPCDLRRRSRKVIPRPFLFDSFPSRDGENENNSALSCVFRCSNGTRAPPH